MIQVQGFTNVTSHNNLRGSVRSPESHASFQLYWITIWKCIFLTCPSDDSVSDNPENLLLETYFRLWFLIQNCSQQYFEKLFQNIHAEYHLIPAESEIWPTCICTRSPGDIKAHFWLRMKDLRNSTVIDSALPWTWPPSIEIYSATPTIFSFRGHFQCLNLFKSKLVRL